MDPVTVPCSTTVITADIVASDSRHLEVENDLQDGLAAWRFREQTTYDLTIQGIAGKNVRVWLGDVPVTDSVRQRGDIAFCRLNWGNYVGASRLRVEVGDVTVIDLPVEIRSYKLDYQTHYRQLLDELSERMAALCFSAGVSTSSLAEIETREPKTPYLTYLILAHLMQPARVPAAVQHIVQHSHKELKREQVWRDFGEVRNVSSRTIRSMVAHPQHLVPYTGNAVTKSVREQLSGHVPTQLEDERVRINLNTPPNRVVRYVLETLTQKLLTLERTFAADTHPHRAVQSQSLAQECRAWSRQVQTLLNGSFLADVGRLRQFPAYSQVLIWQDGYRQIRDAYLRLLLTARVQWEALEQLLEVPNKDLATLYEYWCCFALADAGAAYVNTEPDWSEILSINRGIYQIRLNTNGRFRIGLGPATLFYNRWFHHSSTPEKGSFSVTLHPDFVFQRGDRLWVFDAKYRVEGSDVDRVFETENQDEVEDADDGTRSFKNSDIHKMHTYRDAIKGAVAAFTLYPGDTFRAFGSDGQIYRTPDDLPPDFAGVGAVPLLPGRTTTLETLLKRLIFS